jgi:hypothetical protein
MYALQKLKYRQTDNIDNLQCRLFFHRKDNFVRSDLVFETIPAESTLAVAIAMEMKRNLSKQKIVLSYNSLSEAATIDEYLNTLTWTQRERERERQRDREKERERGGGDI